MQIIDPKFEIILPYPNWDEARKTIYAMIERAGRTCYKSERAITQNSAEKFVRNVVKLGHEAMLEHAGLTVRFIVDRGVSHELVRHRLASFAQESTRYCNYGADKFGKEITFIRPCFLKKGTEAHMLWESACAEAEAYYMQLLEKGCTPEQARGVLPNSLKTEVVMTANMREWRHFFRLRAIGETGKPHPQMEEVAMPLLEELKFRLPALFDDLEVKT